MGLQDYRVNTVEILTDIAKLSSIDIKPNYSPTKKSMSVIVFTQEKGIPKFFTDLILQI